MSATGEDGLALLKDRAHGLLAVIAPQPAPCVLQLVAEVGLQVFRKADSCDQALGLSRSQRRDFGDLLAVTKKGLIEAVNAEA